MKYKSEQQIQMKTLTFGSLLSGQVVLENGGKSLQKKTKIRNSNDYVISSSATI